MNIDETYMQLALNLAESAKGRTNPNPMVGAVIVNNGVIVGTGIHRKAGEPHAEVHAFQMAGKHAEGATLYVTLEPCSHYGKTPPCANLVKDSRVARVVVAMRDPNPEVSGRGIRLLEEAGIEVTVGVLEKEAMKLNERFIYNMRTSMPFVVCKYAMTSDGKIAVANGHSKWITGAEARQDVHEYRDAMDGILVGIQTVLADNPSLTTRLSTKVGKNPTRIIVDRQLKTPLTANVMNTKEAKTILVTSKKRAYDETLPYRNKGVDIIFVEETDGKLHLKEMLHRLYDKGMTDILVEGGSAIHASFFKNKLVQKAVVYVAPKFIGGKNSLTPLSGDDETSMDAAVPFYFDRVDIIGEDMRIIAYPKE